MAKDRTEEDERLAREQAQAHPPSWASMFDHADPPLFEDAGPSYHPDEHSSAAKIGRTVKRRNAEVAKRRDLAVVRQAADAQNDQKALDEVADLPPDAEIPHALLIRAARAARRQGVSIPSAVQLAAKVGR